MCEEDYRSISLCSIWFVSSVKAAVPIYHARVLYLDEYVSIVDLKKPTS